MHPRLARGAWRSVAWAAAMAGWIFSAPALRADSKWVWTGVKRVVALGDVHGRYDQLTAILIGTGMTDEELRWTGRDDHLVLCGDLVDRGEQDRAVLNLVRRLQGEARDAGGQVHVILGNHEVMNMTRDFRYVRPGGYAAFARDEDPHEREEAWHRAEKAFTAEGAKKEETSAAFDEKYPPGYFARRDAFSRDGEYGSWLLEQPSVIEVNGTVFVHGGLTPEVAALGIDEINERVRKSLESFMQSAEVLQQVLTVPGSFRELHETAQQVVKLDAEGRRLDPHLVSAAQDLIDQIHELPFAPNGPQWYRGLSLESERLERDPFRSVLDRLGAQRMMVGHTVTRTGRVSTRFQGHLIRGDVGMGYGRRGYAVLFEGGKVDVVDPATRQASLPFVEPPYGEGWSGGAVHMSDVAMAQFLRTAEVTARDEVSLAGSDGEIWDLQGKDMKLRAVFKYVEQDPPSPPRHEARRYQHERAAYELDRLLDIELVPTVVLREVDGRRGALRPVVEEAEDLVSIRTYEDLEGAPPEKTIETVARTYGLGVEELRQQVIRARVFDGLIGNLGRRDVDTLFVPAEGRVVLVDHEGAFGLSSDLDTALLDPCRPIPADLQIYLQMLNAGDLREKLGDSLDDAQIDAILKRRDRVLGFCGPERLSSLERR
ncbi:MAG: metallophosphoesterase [Acidobacteria bacterium]|nr:metallophosphoesterase [Acidobacteriota bacterium]